MVLKGLHTTWRLPIFRWVVRRVCSELSPRCANIGSGGLLHFTSREGDKQIDVYVNQTYPTWRKEDARVKRIQVHEDFVMYGKCVSAPCFARRSRRAIEFFAVF